MDPRHQAEDEAMDEVRPDPPAPDAPRSRRALLGAAVAAAGGALAAHALAVTDPAEAANGATVKVGRSHSGSAVTQVTNTASSSSAIALKGVAARAGVGVQGLARGSSGNTIGVAGQTASPAGRGVQGTNTGTDGTGVRGVADEGDNAKGVHGRSARGRGVYGQATDANGNGIGVYGETAAGNGVGVWGKGGVTGVAAEGFQGMYVSGASLGLHVAAGSYGIVAQSSYSLGFGVQGTNPNIGVYGISEAANGKGVLGESRSSTGYGVFGRNTAGGNAAYFLGNTFVEGTFASTNKQFQIDHPLEPARKTLTHSCVEAPEMLNVYSGTAVLGPKGTATVRLPRYFVALNGEHRYQLTPIGRTTSVLYVAREISRAGTFRIGGGIAGQKVCWQVTGVRQDAWAKQHPLRVERAKKRRDRGRYLNPDAFGKARSAAMHPGPKVKQPRVRRPQGMRPPLDA